MPLNFAKLSASVTTLKLFLIFPQQLYENIRNLFSILRPFVRIRLCRCSSGEKEVLPQKQMALFLFNNREF